MTLVPMMWSVWGALVLILAALYLYRSRLARDEEDQLFLNESFAHEKTHQSAIVEKVNKFQPILRTSLILTSAATLFVVVYYVIDIINQFK